MYSNLLKGSALAVAISAALAAPSVSHAQDAAPTVGSGLEEIIVTARRREESLQDVPVAVSAFGTAQLEARGVDELGQLNAVVPNVSMYGGGATGESQGSFRMRGVPGVATYVDGVWQATTDGLLTLGVVEVDRIEVLRGPQGTLFGKNAVGGAIQYVTRPPGEEFSARIGLEGGSYNRRDSSLSVDLPISETLKTKFTAASLFREGFVDSLSVNRSWGDINDRIARADVLWEPTDAFSARFVAERSDVDRWGPPRVLLEMGDPVYNPVTGVNSNPRAQAYANIGRPFTNLTHTAGYPGGVVGEYQNRSTWEGRGLRVDLDRYTLDLNWAFSDTMDFRSITAFREHYRTAQTDFDAADIFFIERDFRSKGEQFSQEFQLLGTHDRVSWVGGLFLWDERDDARTWTWIAPEFRDPALRAQALAGGRGVTPASVTVPASTLDALNRVETDGWALFGDVSYDLTDKLRLSLGIRTQDEDLTSGSLIPVVAAPALPGIDPAGDDFATRGRVNAFESAFDAVTWRASLQYQFTPDVMGYVGYSEGFSAGGISVPNLPQYPDIPTAIPYQPETLENFEIGMRADWLDGLLRTNVTLFDGSYDDIQVTNYLFTRCTTPVACDGPLTQLPNLNITNAAKANVRGLEFESVFYPGDFAVNVNLGLLDTEYTEIGAAADAVRPGDPFAQAPESTLSVGVQYEHTLESGATLTPRIDYTWTDDYTLATDYRNQSFQEAYGLLNARLTYAPADARWRVAVYGTNLTDEYYMNSGFYSESNQLNFVTLGRPREVGASLTFNFD
jgi:iron complex outermembrane receptor protein